MPTQRRALLCGISDYPQSPLMASVKDARNLSDTLSKNEDGSPNFFCEQLLSSQTQVTKGRLRQQLIELFKHECDVALFYFAGHGYQDEFDWYMVTQDSSQYDAGVPISNIIRLAQKSPAKEKFIILDCCNSGGAGNLTLLDDLTLLPPGTSILASSNADQASAEKYDAGEFTSIVIEALRGEAADIQGQVTVAGIYHFANMLLGPWEQRPQFKANISKVTPIRRCKAKIDPAILRKLPIYFETAHSPHPLSPHYDPELEPFDKEKESIFAEMRELAKLDLLVPDGTEYLYHAALHSKACKLTPLGRFYWKLAHKNQI